LIDGEIFDEVGESVRAFVGYELLLLLLLLEELSLLLLLELALLLELKLALLDDVGCFEGEIFAVVGDFVLTCDGYELLLLLPLLLVLEL